MPCASTHPHFSRAHPTTPLPHSQIECKPVPVSRAPCLHPAALRVEAGDVDDYRALAHFHYRAGRPATFARILRLVETSEHAPPLLAGVLVASFPPLWGSWRRRVWPGEFESRDVRVHARHVNRRLRSISRVIVDPRFRGLGAAVTLVKAYLADPCTPLTEAITSMGRYSPFFASAGMTPHDVPLSPRDVELLAALRGLRISPSSLIDMHRAAGVLARPGMATALRRWHARGQRQARRTQRRTLLELALLAGAALSARPIMYSHGV